MPKKESPKKDEGFYDAILEEAERVRLPRARRVEGLDEEIALLRVRLGSLLEGQPENLPLFLKGMEMLVKAVAARYRLSKKAEADLYQSVVGVLKGVGDMLWPEGTDGV
ncbi:MAG: hypothetical protein HY676_05585 [Chloroflexi bacterium]|nr:hypothetical protein [Chloroflexota bacterium]